MLCVFILGVFHGGVRKSDCVAPNDKVTMYDELERCERKRS